ncbi:MAG: hypothetical protein AB8B97_02760 [Granulosicoccus sp.]
MFIPMGTVVTVCMIICVVFANRLPAGALNTRTPGFVLRTVGFICGAAGLWNILWYASRHVLEFWGQMAFGSGLLLCALSALLILPAERAPAALAKARHGMVLALALFAAYYAWTIYNL